MKLSRRLFWLVLLLAVVTGYQYSGPRLFSGANQKAVGNDVVRQAFERRLNRKWLESSGQVLKPLRDDLDGDRHQRFIVRVPGGITVLLSHNIDLAPRVPLHRGSKLSFRGRYEWNEKGGVVHWTHHDPQGRIRGGWIALQGKRYQ